MLFSYHDGVLLSSEDTRIFERVLEDGFLDSSEDKSDIRCISCLCETVKHVSRKCIYHVENRGMRQLTEDIDSGELC